jgi:hypothetical protein
MRVLADENIPKLTVQALKELGHDVLDIRGTDKQGTDDEDFSRLFVPDFPFRHPGGYDN